MISMSNVLYEYTTLCHVPISPPAIPSSYFEKMADSNKPTSRSERDGKITTEPEEKEESADNSTTTSDIICDKGKGGDTEISQSEDELPPFLFLPAEMTLKIFSYLEPGELLIVSRTCQCWEEMAFTPTLWTKLDLEMWPNEVTTEFLCDFLKKIPGLQRLLKLAYISEFSNESLAAVTELLPCLQEVDLSFCDVDLSCLTTLRLNCPHLKTLSLDSMNGRFDCRFIEAICQLSHVENINLSHCAITEELLVYLTDHMCNIRSLDVSGVLNISDVGMEKVLTRHCQSLRELVLDGEDLTDDTIKLIASTCSNLHKLQIFFCEQLTDKSLQFLEKLEELRIFTLRKGPEFSKEAFLQFFRNSQLKHVRYLDLTECINISDEAVLALCQKFGKSLRHLDLSWCWHLSETGLISIVDHCSHLEVFKIIGAPIKGECLHRIPEELPYLTFCDFEKCDFINDDILEEVVIKKPNIKITNYHGLNVSTELDIN